MNIKREEHKHIFRSFDTETIFKFSILLNNNKNVTKIVIVIRSFLR